jgi:hypothetical protein
MGVSEITVGELLYEAAVEFTEVVEYGVSLEGVLAGKMAVPPAGARFDVGIRGSLRGPRLSGTITGVDYLHMRADGRAQLHAGMLRLTARCSRFLQNSQQRLTERSNNDSGNHIPRSSGWRSLGRSLEEKTRKPA